MARKRGGGQKGNLNSATHGARSKALVTRRAGYIKQSVLQPVGLRQADLDGFAKRQLDIYARAMSKVEKMDDWVAQYGWLDPDGNPPPFTPVYFAALNSCRLALRELKDHLKAGEQRSALDDYVEATYREADGA